MIINTMMSDVLSLNPSRKNQSRNFRKKDKIMPDMLRNVSAFMLAAKAIVSFE